MSNTNHVQAVIDDLEELLAERAEIDAQIAARKKKAKEDGFSISVINTVLKRRKLTPEKRDEIDALVNITEAALGMLGGKPLNEAALRRLAKEEEEARQMPLFDDDDAAGGEANETPRPAPEPVAQDSEDEARAKGAAAAQAGQKVTDNPYPPRSVQRAAWDEAWCQSAGSDGMEIPEAFKPTPKPKKPKPTKGGAADDGAEQ